MRAGSRIGPGSVLDGIVLGDCLHEGDQSKIYAATGAEGDPRLVVKLPRVTGALAIESLLGFETESTILPALAGPHVPRVVRIGDLARTPYLALERLEGRTLAARLADGALPVEEVASVGAAVADALHKLHRQRAVHCDLKPGNLLLRPGGGVVLLDFGFAHHERFPDLLAEERRFSAGSAPYVSPEQVLGARGDPRSDLFSLGVVLYECATGRLPFGNPGTQSGLRNRLWLEPVPPVSLRPDLPPWLQEVILRCLEPQAEARYQSAALVAFDLRHGDEVRLTALARRVRRATGLQQLRRWWRARAAHWTVAPEAPRCPAAAPVAMIAIDTSHPDDPRLSAIHRAVLRLLATAADFRLACVSVLRAAPVGAPEGDRVREHLARLQAFAEPLRLPPERLSLHVLEAPDAAAALLEFAGANHVDLIVLGAPVPDEHAFAWWRSAASSVTAHARCSVHVVRVTEAER